MRQALPAHVTTNCTHGDNHGDLQHRENVLAAFNVRLVSISTSTLRASRRGHAEGCKGVHLKLSLADIRHWELFVLVMSWGRWGAELYA